MTSDFDDVENWLSGLVESGAYQIVAQTSVGLVLQPTGQSNADHQIFHGVTDQIILSARQLDDWNQNAGGE